MGPGDRGDPAAGMSGQQGSGPQGRAPSISLCRRPPGRTAAPGPAQTASLRENALPVGQDQPFHFVSARTHILDRTEREEPDRGAWLPCPAQAVCADLPARWRPPRSLPAPAETGDRLGPLLVPAVATQHKAGKRRHRNAAIRLWRRKASFSAAELWWARASGAGRRLLRNLPGLESKVVALLLEHLSSKGSEVKPGGPLTGSVGEARDSWFQGPDAGYGKYKTSKYKKKQIQDEQFRCVWATAVG